MRAIFHLCADLDIVVQNESPDNSVCIGIKEMLSYGDGEPAKFAVKETNLTKSQARAIASALMACAAEL